jgi:hypothetical protein
MISIDSYLLDFIKDNIITLSILYAILRSMFPESRLLKAIGEAFNKRFGKGK